MHSARVIATLLLGTIAAAGPSFADDAAATGAPAAGAADLEPAAHTAAVEQADAVNRLIEEHLS